MVRLMTWNCQGLDGAAKFNALMRYRTHRNIDTVFIQEGSDAYDNPNNNNNARVASCDEQHGGRFSNVSNVFDLCDPAPSHVITRVEEVTISAFGNVRQRHGLGADGSNKKYTLINPSTSAALVPETPDYSTRPTMRTFIMQPATDWVTAQPSPVQVAAPGCGAKRKRADSLSTRSTKRGIQLVLEGDLTKDTVKQKTHGPTELRINLISRRRPRQVTMTIQGAPFDIYFWHAPLGNQAQLGAYDLLPAYAACQGHASGGDLATIANILFAEYLDIKAAFPSNTLLVGDLNIDNVAVQHIYHTTNVISSLDGWCHVVAPEGLALAQQFVGDFVYAGGRFPCQVLGIDMDSDHAPVIVDV